MKLVTYGSLHGPARTGLIKEDKVLDLIEIQNALGKAPPAYFDSMAQLIGAGDEGLAEVRFIERKAPKAWGYSVDKVDLKAALYDPIRMRQSCLYFDSINEIVERVATQEAARASDPEKAKRERIEQLSDTLRIHRAIRNGDPEKELRDAGIYFRLHKGDPPKNLRDEMPSYWSMDALCASQPGDEVKVPAFVDKPQFSAQVGAVIGRKGVDIPLDKASNYIFGYVLIHDMSIRNRAPSGAMSGRIGSIPLRPGADFAGCFGLGPIIVTKDEFALDKEPFSVSLNSQEIAKRVPGSPTYSFEDAIKYLSRNVDMHPTDVIASGPLPGLSSLMVDKEINRGDLIELRSAKLGTLRTKFT